MIGRWKKPPLSVDGEYWGKLAVEVRKRADARTNPRSKQTMIKVAQAYERRALSQEKNQTPVKHLLVGQLTNATP
jgi:hypothetical protein